MNFSKRGRYTDKYETFTEKTAPNWLTSANQIPGSTMDDSWFWKLHVLPLKINEEIFTDFSIIRRLP